MPPQVYLYYKYDEKYATKEKIDNAYESCQCHEQCISANCAYATPMTNNMRVIYDMQ